MSPLTSELAERLRPLIGDTRGEPEPLDGGITNRNFRLRTDTGDYVLRLFGRDTSQLGIDRRTEEAATEAAAATGVGPPLVAFLDEAAVTGFIDGRPVPPERLRESPFLERVAASLRTVHAGPSLPSGFSAFRIVESYDQRAGEVPPDYHRALAHAREIEAALTGPEHEPVHCHNDLLNANLIDDGERVRIVDWEYAGMGDRYFDLGNLSINNGFEEGDDERLLAAYFEEPCTPGRFAALRLMRIMSDFREAMWGVVQQAVSELDFDFADYAATHFARLDASVADPRYRGWLEEAARG
jgi:thiamine kinase-like enzyme